MAEDTLSIRRPDDFHLHLRQGDPLGGYVRLTRDSGIARAVVMPNTLPPITTPAGLEAYRREITAQAGDGFTPLMTFKLMPGMTASRVAGLQKAGALMGKYYPAGATTHSSDGLSHWSQCREALEEMERLGLVFSVHGEDPRAPALEREQAFLDEFQEIAAAFPRLRMVFEHVSSAEAVERIAPMGDRVGLSVTAHHLLLTQEDIIGGGLKPHLFCRPLPKAARDRDALRELVFSGFPRVFYGSDSAPHPRSAKECASGAAGIFTAPVALVLLVDLFDRQGRRECLEPFLSERGAAFYGLPLNRGRVTFVREGWTVPDCYGDVVPFMAGREIPWRLR